MSVAPSSGGKDGLGEAIFSQSGQLSRHLKDFRYRPQQQAMCEAVGSAIAEVAQLIVEAGTGVGKTLAYLIPALRSKKKIVISTGTRHLQDQLYFKDLPVVLNFLKQPVKTTLLKGRSNYLCLHHLEQYAFSERKHHRGLAKKIQVIKEWSQLTKTGEIAEVTAIHENDPVWSSVTSTPETCLGGECPSYEKCHVLKARQRAQRADVVIINHHLFFADLVLKAEGFGEVFPSANAIIFDEAHQLPELASTFLAISVSSRQLGDLADDVIAAWLEEALEEDGIQPLADTLKKELADYQLVLVGKKGRFPWIEHRNIPKIQDQFEALAKAVHVLYEALLALNEQGRSLAKCTERCERVGQALDLISQGDEKRISWLECSERGFKLHSTPLVVADAFQSFIQQYECSWIFTSATLTVNKKFDHFQQQLGLHEAETLMLDSPYDYQHNTRLYLPALDVGPNDQTYTHKVIDAVLPLLEKNQGRTFLLFTSHRALQAAARYLAKHEQFTLLVQGDAPRRELLSAFSTSDQAVLLGTSSFWEGVDIRGDTLSCVVIDKLPFASPGDPVLRGRLQAMRQGGENPFTKYQLPQAVIALKQGVGRLIRDEEDYGVVVICDPRMSTKPYGKIFIDSLPRMLRASSLEDAIHFLRSHGTEHATAGH